MLGTHWLGEAEGCDAGVLADVAVVQGLLDALPREASLTAVQPAVVQQQPDGVVGMVLLAESHASVHTIPSAGTAFVDLFSCAAFDAAAVERLVRAALAPRTLHTEIVQRGHE